MENNKIAIIGIIVEDNTYVDELNNLIHQYNNIIVGRMGIPYKNRNIGVISLIVDATNDEISAFSGKLGMIKGVSSKTMYAKVKNDNERNN